MLVKIPFPSNLNSNNLMQAIRYVANRHPNLGLFSNLIIGGKPVRSANFIITEGNGGNYELSLLGKASENYTVIQQMLSDYAA